MEALVTVPSREEAVLCASEALSSLTSRLSRECCCNLYSINKYGTVMYFTGKASLGGACDVVVRFLTDIFAERLKLTVFCPKKRRARYEGFIHSHPYDMKRERPGGGYADGLSDADCAITCFAKVVYMVSPDGRIYSATRAQYLAARKAGANAGCLTALRCADKRDASQSVPFSMPTKWQFVKLVIKRCFGRL